jgi:hypothetical protein
MKALILLSILTLPALADDVELAERDPHYQGQVEPEHAYTACYEHLFNISPAMAHALEYCMTDQECESASQRCEVLSHE